jgi:hypothetical protein
MSQTHWKRLHNPDYLGAYSLEPGKDMILTIKTVKNEMVQNPDGKKEECMIAIFVEPQKPMIINATNAKVIEKLYKTPYIEEWSGKKIQLFVDKIKAFGDVVEALRIRPKIPTSQEAVPTICADCKLTINGVEGRTAEQIAKHTYTKYGRSLCPICATKANEAGKVEN